MKAGGYKNGGNHWQCAFLIAFRAPTSDQAIEADVLTLDTCICSGQSTSAHATGQSTSAHAHGHIITPKAYLLQMVGK